MKETVVEGLALKPDHRFQGLKRIATGWVKVQPRRLAGSTLNRLS
jgi:hypothetical protein